MDILTIAFAISFIWATLKFMGKIQIAWKWVLAPVWGILLVQFIIGFIQGIVLATYKNL